MVVGYLLGFVAPAGDGYIHVVAVREDYRTLGLGRMLYETFEKAARERGAVALKAITSPGNERPVAFHKRVGFTEMVRVEDYGGSGRARIVMRKPLSQPPATSPVQPPDSSTLPSHRPCGHPYRT